jgi:acyl-coenzyme A thioesterase PaaI-like protein
MTDVRGDLDSIKSVIEELTPFTKKVGVRVTSIAPGEVVLSLEPDPTNMTGLRALHPSALFALCEAAATSMAVAALGAVALASTRQVEITYKRATQAPARATCRLDGEEVVRLRNELDRAGIADVHLPVVVLDKGGQVVVEARVTLGLRRTDDTIR